MRRGIPSPRNWGQTLFHSPQSHTLPWMFPPYDLPVLLTRTRQVVYALITLSISSYCCWQNRAFYMHCFFLIYTSTKLQSSIDLFVSNCIHNSLQDLISDVNSKGSKGTSWPTCSDLFWFNTNYLMFPSRCARLLELHNPTRSIWLVQLVIGYLNTCTS